MHDYARDINGAKAKVGTLDKRWGGPESHKKDNYSKDYYLSGLGADIFLYIMFFMKSN